MSVARRGPTPTTAERMCKLVAVVPIVGHSSRRCARQAHQALACEPHCIAVTARVEALENVCSGSTTSCAAVLGATGRLSQCGPWVTPGRAANMGFVGDFAEQLTAEP